MNMKVCLLGFLWLQSEVGSEFLFMFSALSQKTTTQKQKTNQQTNQTKTNNNKNQNQNKKHTPKYDKQKTNTKQNKANERSIFVMLLLEGVIENFGTLSNLNKLSKNTLVYITIIFLS